MKLRNIASAYFDQTEGWASSAASYGAEVFQADRFVINDTAEGKVATFTVQAGDATSTAVVDGQTVIMAERSEVILGYWNTTEFKVVGAEEAVEYHRMTVKLHSPWTQPDVNAHGYHWGTLWQLHGPNNFIPGSPPMGLDVQEKYRLWMFGGDGTNGRYLDLSDSSLAVDTWVSWVIEVKWRFDNTGYVRLWRKNEGAAVWTEVAASYNIPTLAWRGVQSGYPHYTKCGYYRSASSHTNTVSHRKIIRTSKRALAFA